MQQHVHVVINDIDDWQPYYPSQSLLTANEYLSTQKSKARSHIVNLCNDLSYLSTGYYVSLLGEARGQRVLPSVTTINDLNNFRHYQLLTNVLDKTASKYLLNYTDNTLELIICFGVSPIAAFAGFARQLFERYPCPILRVQLRQESRWYIHSLTAGQLNQLSDEQQTFFGDSLDAFNKRVWRKARAKKEYRYDLAILYNPDEAIPTSDKKALTQFIKAAKEADIEAELITAEDYSRLLEFDALFIRETTRINHYTYHFAKKAEANGMVVIDHPESIVKCANKVFLKELLEQHNVGMPKTELLLSGTPLDYAALGESLGYPVVLKIPDGSFSIGVEKADNAEEFEQVAIKLFEQSTILLAQEFLKTDYDWRIGVLNNRPIYACQYFMARNHWQIYNHKESSARAKSGSFETFGVHQAPKDVVKVALQATRLIGDGLYGVDVKMTRDGPVIIEINDNPSIESGVEDKHLGYELYRLIMADFGRRLDEQ
ncbi:MAG: RimK family alpha-L-glutamate ligase [Idiomarina sp.]|nr:RimK family protein [Idiomarina sp.]PHQ77357.1 MAG: RimK family alpha-L-glutamate ligase [Idiomarina sp.]